MIRPPGAIRWRERLALGLYSAALFLAQPLLRRKLRQRARTDIAELRNWALEHKIELTVVGPEGPLAAEAAVAIAIVINIYRNFGSIDAEDADSLKL